MKATLIIILIALAVVVFLFTTKDSKTEETYHQRVMRALTQAEQLALDSKITNIKRALEAYNMDNDRYPDTLEELIPLYLRIEEFIKDPWGEFFQLDTDEESNLIITSAGKDRTWGNDDDLKRKVQ